MMDNKKDWVAIIPLTFLIFVMWGLWKQRELSSPNFKEGMVVVEITKEMTGCRYRLECVDTRFRDAVIIDDCHLFKLGDTLKLASK